MNNYPTCKELGYCPILGNHSNPTVFDCNKYCPNRKDEQEGERRNKDWDDFEE